MNTPMSVYLAFIILTTPSGHKNHTPYLQYESLPLYSRQHSNLRTIFRLCQETPDTVEHTLTHKHTGLLTQDLHRYIEKYIHIVNTKTFTQI